MAHLAQIMPTQLSEVKHTHFKWYDSLQELFFPFVKTCPKISKEEEGEEHSEDEEREEDGL